MPIDKAACAGLAAAAATALLLFGSSAMSQDAADASDAAERVAAARERLASIRQRAGRVDDINRIENLQASFGYYYDKMLWEHVLDLFTEEATLEIGLSGVYRGTESIRRYLYALSGASSPRRRRATRTSRIPAPTCRRSITRTPATRRSRLRPTRPTRPRPTMRPAR